MIDHLFSAVFNYVLLLLGLPFEFVLFFVNNDFQNIRNWAEVEIKKTRTSPVFSVTKPPKHRVYVFFTFIGRLFLKIVEIFCELKKCKQILNLYSTQNPQRVIWTPVENDSDKTRLLDLARNRSQIFSLTTITA